MTNISSIPPINSDARMSLPVEKNKMESAVGVGVQYGSGGDDNSSSDSDSRDCSGALSTTNKQSTRTIPSRLSMQTRSKNRKSKRITRRGL